MDKTLKKYLIIAVAAAIGFPVCVILHNLFYAFGESLKHIGPLNYIMEGLHAGFFIIAVIICPVVFLIGIVGTIFRLVQSRRD